MTYLSLIDSRSMSELGGHVPIHNSNMETTVSGIYVAGGEEASTAMEEGKLAGIAIAESPGYLILVVPKDQAMKVRGIRAT